MSDVLIRDLPAAVLQRLKAQARRHGRSLQAELNAILTEAATGDMLEARRVADRVRLSLAGCPLSDSGTLQAEDRMR
jgi:plasmid stability protein